MKSLGTVKITVRISKSMVVGTIAAMLCMPPLYAHASGITKLSGARLCQLLFKNGDQIKTDSQTRPADAVYSQINQEANGLLFGSRSIEDAYQNFGWLKKRAYNRLQYQVDLSRLRTRQNYSEVAANIHALFLNDSLFKTNSKHWLSEKGAESRIRSWTQRQLVEKGLRGLAVDPKIAESSTYARFIDRSIYFFRIKLRGMAILPFRIGHQTDKSIPSEVLQRILENGIETEWPTLERLYQGQRRTDILNALRPYYNLLGFVLLSFLTMELEEEAIERIQFYKGRRNTARLIAQMEATNEGFEELIQLIREEQARQRLD